MSAAWIRNKNRYWRYEFERESAINKRRQRVFGGVIEKLQLVEGSKPNLAPAS